MNVRAWCIVSTLSVLATACGRAERAPADGSASAAPSAVPAAVPNATSDTTPIDTATPRAQSDSPARPRLRPRPPHPVPHPMPRDDSSSATPTLSGDQQADRAAIERVKAAAKALARTDGCSAASQCAVQALGERACGGPEEYVVYCPRATDVAALKRKADELARLERAFNKRYQIVSTCEYRVAPAPQLVGGSCRAASAGDKASVPQ